MTRFIFLRCLWQYTESVTTTSGTTSWLVGRVLGATSDIARRTVEVVEVTKAHCDELVDRIDRLFWIFFVTVKKLYLY